MALTLEPMALELGLPWQVDEQREQAFRRTLKIILIPLLLLFIVVPFLPTVDRSYVADNDLPIRTQILLDPIAEPEPVIKEPEPEPIAPKPAPEPAAPAAPVVQTRPRPTPAPAAPKPEPKPVDIRQSLAQSQGLSELSSQLNAVRGAVNIASMQNKNLSDNVGGEATQADRARLGQELAARTTTTVNETVMRSDITELSAHQSAMVEGVIMTDVPPGSQYSHLSSHAGRRDMESIRRTLEHAKGNIYSLYQRALVDNPGLTGEFTFELVIEPNGTVSELKLLVSELGISDLERNILERIRSVRFSSMDVPPTVVEYRFVFLPS